MVKVLIVDDEQSSINDIKRLLEPYGDYMVCGEALSVKTAIDLTILEKPDLVFLDVEINDEYGFDFLNFFMPKVDFKVIFITAFNKYAIQAIDFSALHYLLKPIGVETFEKAMIRMAKAIEHKSYLERLEQLVETLQSGRPRFIRISTIDKLHKVELKNLVYLKADGNYTHLHHKNGTKITTAKTLHDFEELLNNSAFCRVHKSHMVNLLMVNSYNKRQRILTLDNDIKLAVSVRKEEGFKRALKEAERG